MGKYMREWQWVSRKMCAFVHPNQSPQNMGVLRGSNQPIKHRWFDSCIVMSRDADASWLSPPILRWTSIYCIGSAPSPSSLFIFHSNMKIHFFVLDTAKIQPAMALQSSSPNRMCPAMDLTFQYLPGWWFQFIWKIWKSIGMIIPNIWENKSHVPVTTNQLRSGNWT